MQQSQKPLIIANWKLALDHEESVILAGKIANSQSEFTDSVQLVICPSATSLDAVSSSFGDSSQVEFGAQNAFYEERGPFTGEVSVKALKQLGAKYVIVGHSERRKYFRETNEDVAKKTMCALKHNLIPIVCVGETYEERQRQQAEIVVSEELQAALAHVTLQPNQHIIVAYEPIWAIGTGQAINAEQARLMGLVIHQKMIDLFPQQALKNTRVVYGGSIDGTNVRDFVDDRVLSGVLVGGASQRFADLQSLVFAFKKQ